MLEAANVAGHEGQCRLGLDCAASAFYDPDTGRYQFCEQSIDREDLLERLAEKYKLFMIEDPLQEDDFEGFTAVTRRVPAVIVGNDLFVTNVDVG